MSIYSLNSIVNFTESPFQKEMDTMLSKDIGENGLYFNPAYFNKLVGDMTKLECRLFRILMELIYSDKNYSGVVELKQDILNNMTPEKEFSMATLHIAIKNFAENMKAEGKPFIVKKAPRSRVYWVNPLVVCKKSLLDKWSEFKENSVGTNSNAEEAV